MSKPIHQTVTFKATDMAGNYAEQECTYYVDGHGTFKVWLPMIYATKVAPGR